MNLTCVKGSCLWWWNIFLAHTRTLGTWYGGWPHVSISDDGARPLFGPPQAGQRTVPQRKNRSKLVRGTEKLVFSVKLAATVTGSQSYRAPLECGGKWASNHKCSLNQFRRIAECYKNSVNPQSWKECVQNIAESMPS